MKAAIILSLLLILAYSDDNNYPPNMPKEFYEQMEMQEKCQEAEEEEEQCLSTTLSDSDYRCCVLTIEHPYVIDDSNRKYEKSCFIMYKDITLVKEVYNNPLFKATIREIFGYIRYGLYYIDDDGKKFYTVGDSLKIKEIYRCSDGTAEYSFGYDQYSQTDISVYDSGSHCLKYFYRYMYSEEYDENNELSAVSKDDCLNAQLTQSAIDAGVKCGFFQFTVNFLQGGSKTYQTCYLYNSNFISEGKLDEKTQSQLQAYVSQIGNKEGDGVFSSYTTQFSDESGNTYSFDMDGKYTPPSSISSLLSLSKYLCLLLVLVMI